MNRVLSVASECVPLVKTGGLADVVGALPGALASHGWDMRVLLPAYRGLLAQLTDPKVLWAGPDLFGVAAQVIGGRVDGLSVLLLDAPHLYDRAGGPYGPNNEAFADNAERFAALCWAAAAIARDGLTDDWRPQVLHAHDWQAGLTPAYLRYGPDCDVGTVMTVHNIAFQGHASASKMADLRLPASEFHPDGLEYYGNLSTLKAGLVTADRITTVSPTYANELMRPEYGMGLQGIIASRAAIVCGILNGVDTGIWDPGSDPELLAPFNARSLKKKALNRAHIIAEFDLSDVPGPLAIVVSRLTGQKGIDLLPAVIPDFVAAGGGLLVLGSGEAELERALADLAAAHPGCIGLKIGYDEALSHRMFGGADAVLVPSRFEPCGLTQMYGLRYGTIPVVAATGGLADTVIDANPMALAAGAATGIAFHPTDTLAFSQALRRLVDLHAQPGQWTALQRAAMKAPVGWQASSAAYAALYESLVP